MASDLAALKAAAVGDVDRELAVTRKVLVAVPEGKLDWKPHEKSMTLGRLATHVADLPAWTKGALNDDELNFATAKMPPTQLASAKEIVAYFDETAAGLRDAVEKFDMRRWDEVWTMRNGETIIAAKPRATVFRTWCLSHMISHRASLTQLPQLRDRIGLGDSAKAVFPKSLHYILRILAALHKNMPTTDNRSIGQCSAIT